MTILNYLSKLQAAGLPVISAGDEGDASFSRMLTDAEVDKVTTIALARVALKRQNLVIQNLVKLVLAMRDEIWSDL